MSIRTEKHKFCWEADEHPRGGWRLYFVVGNRKYRLQQTCGRHRFSPVFKTEKDVKYALNGGVVFVHLKERG